MFGIILSRLGLSKLSVLFIAAMVTLVLVIVVPNLSQLMEKFGFDTVASLRQDKTKLNMQLDRTIDTAKATDKALSNMEKVVAINDTVVSTLSDVKSSANKKVEAITAKYRAPKISSFVKSSDAAIKAPKGVEVSFGTNSDREKRDNIDYLWEVYSALNEGESNAS